MEPATRADPEGYDLTEDNGNIPSSMRDWIIPSKVGTQNFSPKNTFYCFMHYAFFLERQLF
jgi:hypothetical protein